MSFSTGSAIDRALALYGAGAAFEAHEVLEEAWHDEARAGPHATLLKALIRVCAARVKHLQGNARGVESHCDAGRALLDDLAAQVGAQELLRVRFHDVRAELERVRKGEPVGLLARLEPPA